MFSNLSPATAKEMAKKEPRLDGEYDRTKTGLKKRFSCLRADVDKKNIGNFPSKQEIDSFIKNVMQLDFISESSVTTATDTKKISPFQLQRLGLNKASVTTHKKAFVELLNYEGTNEEYCALKGKVDKEVSLAVAAAAKKKAEDEARRAAELAAKKKAEDEARRAAELAAKKKAEDEARRAAELAAKKKAEEKARRAAELAAKKKAEDVRVAREESKVLLPALKEFVRSPNSLDIIEVGALLERYQSGATKGWTPQTLLAYQALSQHVKKNEGFSMFLVKKIEDYRLRTNDEIRSLRQEITEVETVLKNFIAENLGSAKANAALKLAQDARSLIQDLNTRNALALKDKVDKWFATNGLKQISSERYEILRAEVATNFPHTSEKKSSPTNVNTTSDEPSAKKPQINAEGQTQVAAKPKVTAKPSQSTFNCKLFQKGRTKFSLAFCAGFTDYVYATSGMKASDPNRQIWTNKTYVAAYKKIDRQCGYSKWYDGNYDDTFSLGGLDHSLAIMAYKADRSAANLRKMQNPLWAEPCERMIKHHMKDIKKLLN